MRVVVGQRGSLVAALLVMLAAAAVADALAGVGLMTGPGVLLVVGAALFVGLWCPPVVASVVVLVGAALMTAAHQIEDPTAYTATNDLVFFLVALGCPTLAGSTWSAVGRQARELERLSAVRASQRTAEVESARIDELNRISSAVQHDVVQALGAIALQAEGAARSEASSARETLPALEESARTVLDQLREHVGVLRDPEEPVTTDVVEVAAPPPRRPALELVDALAALTAVPVAVETVLSGSSHGPAWGNILISLALAAPLLLRRRHPVAAAAAFLALCAVSGWLLTPMVGLVSTILPLVLLAHAAGAWLSRWRARLGALLVLVGGTVAAVVTVPGEADLDGLGPISAISALAVLAGVVSAKRAARVRRLEALLVAIEAGEDAEVRLARSRQRLIVARDLHDSVAAAMTVVCLHAGAAGRLPAEDDERLSATLETVAGTARSALGEVRSSLDVLDRDEDEPAGVAGLEAVVDQARRAGVDVRLAAPTQPVPSALEPLVARVAREALVNVARHAPGAQVTVRVRADAHTVQLDVVDGGATAGALATATPGTGTGLTGLAERLEAHGGTLEHGPVQPHGYRVRARMPVRTGVPA